MVEIWHKKLVNCTIEKPITRDSKERPFKGNIQKTRLHGTGNIG
jgi:hypothetical protein